jgi:hypothetical protein
MLANDFVICEDFDTPVRFADCYISFDSLFFVDGENCRSHELTLLQTYLDEKVALRQAFLPTEEGAKDEMIDIFGGTRNDPINEELYTWIRDCIEPSDLTKDSWLFKDVLAEVEDAVKLKIVTGGRDSGFAIVTDYHECNGSRIDLCISESGLLTALNDRGDLRGLMDELTCEGYTVLLGSAFVVLTLQSDITYFKGVTGETIKAIWKEQSSMLDYVIYKIGDDFVIHKFYAEDFQYDSWMAYEAVLGTSYGTDNCDIQMVDSKHFVGLTALEITKVMKVLKQHTPVTQWVVDAVFDAKRALEALEG